VADTILSIETSVWNYLKAKGLPEKSIASVMGNIEAESSFDPTEVESGNSIGFGLCQWSFGRRTQLESYGKDLVHQEDFLWAELSGQNLAITHADYQWINKSPYLTNTQFMAGSGSIDDLTTAFCFCWERPNVDLAHLDRRIQQANAFFTQFTGTGGGTVDPPPDPTTDGDFYTKLLTTTYNVNQLSAAQITFLKTLSIKDSVKMIFSFNHNKKQIGTNYVGSHLTFDTNTYIINSVRSNGDVVLSNGENVCYNYINPKFIKANS